MQIFDKPLADKGLTSYRAKGRYGWIMIGAIHDADAITQARLSTDRIYSLQVFDGKKYVEIYANI